MFHIVIDFQVSYFTKNIFQWSQIYVLFCLKVRNLLWSHWNKHMSTIFLYKLLLLISNRKLIWDWNGSFHLFSICFFDKILKASLKLVSHFFCEIILVLQIFFQTTYNLVEFHIKNFFAYFFWDMLCIVLSYYKNLCYYWNLYYYWNKNGMY